MITQIQKQETALKLGQRVVYLSQPWEITSIKNSAYFDEPSFAVLERINKIGAHERIKVPKTSWNLISMA
jgi:maltose-binding protein MalE